MAEQHEAMADDMQLAEKAAKMEDVAQGIAESVIAESVIAESDVTISEEIRQADLEIDKMKDLPMKGLPKLPDQPIQFEQAEPAQVEPAQVEPAQIEPTEQIELAEQGEQASLGENRLKSADEPNMPSKTQEPDSLRFIEQILEQSSRISNVDLRDQAYLDLVDYAILRDQFEDAVLALSQISQPALRDTARNRMAIKHALNGNQSSAFNLIDELENPELADFVRLQVVQALIVPDRLPAGVIPR